MTGTSEAGEGTGQERRRDLQTDPGVESDETSDGGKGAEVQIRQHRRKEGHGPDDRNKQVRAGLYTKVHLDLNPWSLRVFNNYPMVPSS